jgi:hypothetical protein
MMFIYSEGTNSLASRVGYSDGPAVSRLAFVEGKLFISISTTIHTETQPIMGKTWSQLFPPKPHFTEKDLHDQTGKVARILFLPLVAQLADVATPRSS